MRRLWQGGVVCLGLLAMAGPGQAQFWPLQVGPSLDVVNTTMADFDRFRREVPPQAQPPVLPLRASTPVPPAWTPPPPPRIRRAAVAKPVTRAVAQAAPPRAPAATAPEAPPARRPDFEAVERRLSERERILRDLQRDLEEERRLVNEWRGSQRAAR